MCPLNKIPGETVHMDFIFTSDSPNNKWSPLFKCGFYDIETFFTRYSYLCNKSQGPKIKTKQEIAEVAQGLWYRRVPFWALHFFTNEIMGHASVPHLRLLPQILRHLKGKKALVKIQLIHA